jgi:hypothetical protein
VPRLAVNLFDTLITDLDAKLKKFQDEGRAEKIRVDYGKVVVASGFPCFPPECDADEHAWAIINVAVTLAEAVSHFQSAHGMVNIKFQIGIDSGSIVAGIIVLSCCTLLLYSHTVLSYCRYYWPLEVPVRCHRGHCEQGCAHDVKRGY